MEKIKSNIWKLHLNTFLKDVLFFIPVLVPLLNQLGFDMQQILLGEAAYALALVILEVPSGYFADRFGRKTSIIIGSVFNVIGFTLYAAFQNFEQYVLANIIIGIGYAFISGADTALLYESLEQTNQLDKYKKVQGTNFAWGRVSSVISTIIGGFLITMGPRLPLYLTIIPFILILFVSLTLRETRVHHEIQEHWTHFKEIVKDSLFFNKKLRNFLLFTSVSGFFVLGIFLGQEYMEFIGLPLAFFGLIMALMNVFSGLASRYAEQIEKYLGSTLSLAVIAFASAFAWLAMGFLQTLWAIPLLIISSIIWGYSTPIFAEFIQKIAQPDRRATVMSIMGLLNRLVYCLFAPIIGYINDIFTIQQALQLGSVIMLAIGTVTLWSLKKVRVI